MQKKIQHLLLDSMSQWTFLKKNQKAYFLYKYSQYLKCDWYPNFYFKILCDATQQMCPVSFERPRLGARRGAAQVVWG